MLYVMDSTYKNDDFVFSMFWDCASNFSYPVASYKTDDQLSWLMTIFNSPELVANEEKHHIN